MTVIVASIKRVSRGYLTISIKIINSMFFQTNIFSLAQPINLSFTYINIKSTLGLRMIMHRHFCLFSALISMSLSSHAHYLSDHKIEISRSFQKGAPHTSTLTPSTSLHNQKTFTLANNKKKKSSKLQKSKIKKAKKPTKKSPIHKTNKSTPVKPKAQHTKSKKNKMSTATILGVYEVKATLLSVRKRPSAYSLKMGELQQGQKVEVYEFKNNWAKIKYSSSYYWVSRLYLTAT